MKIAPHRPHSQTSRSLCFLTVSEFPQVGHRNRSLWSNLSIMPIHSPDILIPTNVAEQGGRKPKPFHDLPRVVHVGTKRFASRSSSRAYPAEIPYMATCKRHAHSGPGAINADEGRGVAPTPSQSLGQQQPPSKRRG